MPDEIEAMRKIDDVLSELDTAEVQRTLAWANSKFEFNPPSPSQSGWGDPDAEHTAPDKHRDPVDVSQYQRAADLLTTADPSTGAERALVMGYWLQEFEEQESFASAQINNELKQLGHGSANITVDFNSLMKPKPQLVIQVSKSGRAQQARKKYRLTEAGRIRVQEMLSNDSAVQ